jgi:hypothetical protein
MALLNVVLGTGSFFVFRYRRRNIQNNVHVAWLFAWGWSGKEALITEEWWAPISIFCRVFGVHGTKNRFDTFRISAATRVHKVYHGTFLRFVVEAECARQAKASQATKDEGWNFIHFRRELTGR